MVQPNAAKQSKRKSPGAPVTRRKAATNLSLRVDLVKRARALHLNLSEVVETALETAIQSVEQTRWLEENQEAIREYNAFVEANGVFSDDWRQF